MVQRKTSVVEDMDHSFEGVRMRSEELVAMHLELGLRRKEVFCEVCTQKQHQSRLRRPYWLRIATELLVQCVAKYTCRRGLLCDVAAYRGYCLHNGDSCRG